MIAFPSGPWPWGHCLAAPFGLLAAPCHICPLGQSTVPTELLLASRTVLDTAYWVNKTELVYRRGVYISMEIMAGM